MSYVTEQIAHTLKRSRENQGLSQREISTRAGVPQSYISKIENDMVDLRVSSLVKLAHVLGLSVMLVPRKNIAAVKVIARDSTKSAVGNESQQSRNELTRLQEYVARLIRKYPTSPELAQIQRQVRDISHFTIPAASLAKVRAAADTIKSYQFDDAKINVLHDLLVQLQGLRYTLVLMTDEQAELEAVRPAYSLDEDDHG